MKRILFAILIVTLLPTSALAQGTTTPTTTSTPEYPGYQTTPTVTTTATSGYGDYCQMYGYGCETETPPASTTTTPTTTSTPTRAATPTRTATPTITATPTRTATPTTPATPAPNTEPAQTPDAPQTIAGCPGYSYWDTPWYDRYPEYAHLKNESPCEPPAILWTMAGASHWQYKTSDILAWLNDGHSWIEYVVYDLDGVYSPKYGVAYDGDRHAPIINYVHSQDRENLRVININNLEVQQSLMWTPWNNICIMYGLEYMKQTNDIVGISDAALAGMAITMCYGMRVAGINTMGQAWTWANAQKIMYEQQAARSTGMVRTMAMWYAAFYEATLIGLSSNPIGF